MKKLLTLCAAVLASVSMWATYAPTADEVIILKDDAYDASATEAGYSKHAAIAWGGTASTNSKKAGDPNNNGEATSSNVPCYSTKGNGGGKNITVSIEGCSQIIVYHEKHSSRYVELRDGSATGTLIGKGVANTYFTTVDLDANTAYSIFLHGTAGSDDQDFYIYAVKLIKGETCTDPEASIAADANIFVGDAKDLAFTSSNTSTPDYAVTLDGETVSAEAYTIADGNFTANVAGEFVITVSQAADGTHCEALKSVTLNASEKSPVNTIEVTQTPDVARIGTEVTLTVVTDNAADTIYWTLFGSVVENAHSATLTFTPEAAGTYTYAAWARNQFNETGEWKVDDIDVTVAVGTDATLSDLKVNGTTIDGFDAATLTYNLGEIGVYDALTVTATAADAPSATTEVVDNQEGKVTVTVTAEDKSTKEYVLNYTRAAATALVAISESTTWDWSKAGSATAQWSGTTLPTNAEEFNFADVLINPDAGFNAAALSGIAQYANRGTYFQGNQVAFKTTVPGTVVVTYSNTGGNRPYRHVKVNDDMSAAGSDDQTMKDTEAFTVSEGDVVITFYIPDAENPKARDGDNVGPSMGRISKIVFTKSDATAIGNTEAEVKAVKRIVDGQLLIEKNGVLYNAQGARL